MEIISHQSREYFNIKPNGALIYSRLICKYLIPKIKTDRNWVTINTGNCFDHSIVFIHSNINTYKYEYLKKYKDLILICSQKSTMNKVRKYGRTIYLPLSIDIDYVRGYREQKTKELCYAGRANKIHKDKVPQGVEFLQNRTHPDMLRELSRYKKVYAVGLTALEAKALDCKILPYDPRFPDPDVWVLRDIKDMVPELQKKLDLAEKRIKNDAKRND